MSFSNPLSSGPPAAFPAAPAVGAVMTPGGSASVPNYNFNSHLQNDISNPFVPTVNSASTVWGSKNNSARNTPAGSRAPSPLLGSTPAVPAAPGSAAFKTEWDEMKSIVLGIGRNQNNAQAATPQPTSNNNGLGRVKFSYPSHSG